MKTLFSIVIFFFSIQVLSQSSELEKYNLDIIDSCISKIDTTIKIVYFHFANGNDPVFERTLVDTINAIDSIALSQYSRLPEDSQYGEIHKGIRISIYYESTSCMLQAGYFLIDPDTGEKILYTSGIDFSYCWTFKAGLPIAACRH